MNFVKTTIRCECDLDDIENGFKTIAGKTIAAWSGAGAQFQFLLKRGTNLLDVSNLSSVTLTILAADRTGSAFLTKTISGVAIDNTVDAASWADGSKQHLKFDLTGAEMALPVTTGQTSTIYFLVLSGYTTDAPTDPDTFAWAQIAIHRDGVPTASTYVQAGNLVSGGATYDGSGHYVLSVTAGKYYKWVDGGANDTSVTNGAQTVTVDGTNFLTQGATITLNGTPSAVVTATIYPSPIITADEISALVTSLITGTGGVVTFDQTIGNGVDRVVVDYTSLGLVATPTSILPTIVKPNVGAKIGCSLIDGTATSTQCTVELDATTELGTYKVRLFIKP